MHAAGWKAQRVLTQPGTRNISLLAIRNWITARMGLTVQVSSSSNLGLHRCSNKGSQQQGPKRKNEHEREGKKKRRQQGRQWGGVRSRERNIDTPVELAEGSEREERRPKKKVACFIGYSGEGYHGMQLSVSYIKGSY